jgi:hypothetical protein
MKPLATISLGAALLFGTMVAFGKNARFVGDKATKGDEVLADVDAIPELSPELRAAAQIAQGSTVVVRVDSETEEAVRGPILRFTFAQTEVPLDAALQARIGSVTVPRSAIRRVTRDGQVVA